MRNLLSRDAVAKSQHDAVRNTCGWYNFTHRLVEIKGPDAMRFLDSQYANAIYKTKVGAAKYTLMLNEDGDIVDDVVIFRLAEDRFWISTFYSNVVCERFATHKGEYDFEYEVITDSWRMYSVQGPRSKELVSLIADESIEELKFFNIRDNSVGGIPVKISRGGYTGEKWGFEIYVPFEHAKCIETALEQNGPSVDAMKVTNNDVKMMTLACEAGFLFMVDMLGLNPFEVGNDNLIDWSKEFVGKSALEKIRKEGWRRKLVGYTVDDVDALIAGSSLYSPHGAPVVLNGKIVGKATKYTCGFTVGKNIGYAVIDSRTAKIGDHVKLNGYDAVLTKVGVL